ncbi:MAG: hypothetical protein CL840_14710 [Crocinitomicaceae bacterium]|nr:hypothetical protein [Crocinitomicaceae bacterium]|tara:strand:+ start:20567 stop:21814 length:1248 start_codon:yes stop_codon:yes gene_type:complete
MRKITLIQLSVMLLSMLLCLSVGAQDDKKGKPKKDKNGKKWSKKIWGDYDSNAVPFNLAINDAYVTYNDKLLEGVIVNVLVNGEIFMADTTDKEGGFSFNLKFDHRYVLAFIKDQYVTKRVEIDLSNMPAEAKKEGYDLGKFNMGMIKYAEGMDIEEYKIAVARYKYDEINKIIQLDRTYFRKRKELLAVVNKQNEKVLANKDAEDQDLQNDYDILIRDADIEFAAKDYQLAKEFYLEALKLKSLEEYPRKQLKIIEGYLEQDLNAEEKYQALISQGDEAFNVKDYESALLAYKNATRIKTTEAYPRDQVKKIEGLKAAEKAPVAATNEKKNYSLANIKISTENKGLSNELAKKYPQGLTEETYTEGSKTIVRRIIVDGDIGVEYKKIIHNWGGVYYFKNGNAVNHFVWQKEAIQ